MRTLVGLGDALFLFFHASFLLLLLGRWTRQVQQAPSSRCRWDVDLAISPSVQEALHVCVLGCSYLTTVAAQDGAGRLQQCLSRDSTLGVGGALRHSRRTTCTLHPFNPWVGWEFAQGVTLAVVHEGTWALALRHALGRASDMRPLPSYNVDWTRSLIDGVLGA